MSIHTYQLSDGRFLGIEALEVLTLPQAGALAPNPHESGEKLSQAFSQMISELNRLANANTCIEFLWAAEKVTNQTIASRIRIFGILRKIGPDRQSLEVDLTTLRENMATSLSALQYGVTGADIASPEFAAVLGGVDDSCVYGIVKSEKCVGNASSPYPYYYADVVAGHNGNNFNSIISALSQLEGCCVSFQLFPVTLTAGEMQMISEAAAEMGRIASGIMVNYQMVRDMSAEAPSRVYSYYAERRSSPFFMYNILTFGSRPACASLATRLVSLLQSGEAKVVTSDFMCLDLTGEKIDLDRQFTHYVWNVNNRLLYYYRNTKLQSVVPLARNLFRLPYIMTAEEAVAFFRLPYYEKTMTALKSSQISGGQEQFSKAVVSEDNIRLGTLVSNDSASVVIGCPEQSFTKHALIVGMPGSGKTTFAVDLLLQFAKRGIPFLAIEPTKSEYRAMIDALPDLRIFTPGNNAVAPYIINPFIPPRGIKIEQYIPSLASAFKAAFSMPSPLDMIFLRAIRASYIQYGWKDYSQVGDPDVTLFGLQEFILVFRKLMENTNYSKEVRGNIESAGLLRLTNLIEQNSNIYDTINTVPIEDLLTAPTVLELNSIDNAEQKSLIMALLLISICLYTKHNQAGDGKLKNAILIDEAHVLLGGGSSGGGDGQPDAQASTVRALQDMIAEIRSYGTSIIIADQSPTKVSREVVANTDIKVAFRLVQSVEKEMIADSTNMDEEGQRNLGRLTPGQAYVYYSKLEAPQMVRTEDIREKEGIRLSVTDDEVAGRVTYWNSHKELLKPYTECDLCPQCRETCDFKVRANAEFIANAAMNKYRSALKNAENLKKCVFHLPDLMEKQFDACGDMDRTRLQICARIKLYRKATLELPISVSQQEKETMITRFPRKKENG